MTKIKVVDLIMGGGKSTYTHNEMYVSRTKKYIYITPYLDEVKRLIGDADMIHLHFQSFSPNTVRFHFQHFRRFLIFDTVRICHLNISNGREEFRF